MICLLISFVFTAVDEKSALLTMITSSEVIKLAPDNFDHQIDPPFSGSFDSVVIEHTRRAIQKAKRLNASADARLISHNITQLIL